MSATPWLSRAERYTYRSHAAAAAGDEVGGVTMWAGHLPGAPVRICATDSSGTGIIAAASYSTEVDMMPQTVSQSPTYSPLNTALAVNDLPP